MNNERLALHLLWMLLTGAATGTTVTLSFLRSAKPNRFGDHSHVSFTDRALLIALALNLQGSHSA
jgi:hypothetical protein